MAFLPVFFVETAGIIWRSNNVINQLKHWLKIMLQAIADEQPPGQYSRFDSSALVILIQSAHASFRLEYALNIVK